MEELWTCYGACRQGEYHRKNNMECQDKIAYKREKNRQAIALVDGVGTTDHNAIAGERVVKAVADFMIRSFDRVRRETKYSIGTSLMKEIYDIIYELMKQYHLPASEFNSTLLGACIDLDQGTYFVLHLGDGVIVGQEERERIISYPFNGAGEGETCLTMSEQVLEKLKVMQGALGEMKTIALCSDGVYESRKNVSQVFECISEFKDTKSFREKEDDQSIIMLEIPHK